MPQRESEFSPVTPLSEESHGEGVGENSKYFHTLLTKPRFLSKIEIFSVWRAEVCFNADILRLLRVETLLLLGLGVEAWRGASPDDCVSGEN